MKNNKIKSSLILLVTLIIGAAIGFQISEISIKKKFEEMESIRERGGFLNTFDRIIKPEKEQKAIVDSIIISYHNRIELVTEGSMKEVGGLIDSMITELKNVLNEEQYKRLQEEHNKMKQRPPRRKGPPMPPPPDERREHPLGEKNN